MDVSSWAGRDDGSPDLVTVAGEGAGREGAAIRWQPSRGSLGEGRGGAALLSGRQSGPWSFLSTTMHTYEDAATLVGWYI